MKILIPTMLSISSIYLFTESSVAIYTATSRGRMQLIYGGQPFIFEKILKLSSGEEKRFWRCNQWWNQKCRSRVFTINDVVCPLNRFHTHEEIVRRKKRVRRVPAGETSAKAAATTTTTGTTRQQLQQQQLQDQHQQNLQDHQQQQQQQQQHHQQQQQHDIHHQQMDTHTILTTTLEEESPATIDVGELGMHLK
ncbi:TPR-containing protein DDB_G0280363 [Drosophila willistoni]|uniref:TPR-containing protein DDB_G0280363 n=1 Tax=Drosophila willistoni TaxID=7260 RepID=UPI001F086AB1|nr:TPR-containing protein DDB_G0280363 [Drosophila willistoni]